MTAPPRLLDLFCGAGGAAMGYSRAGFEVVGVDHKPQPNYPFEFHQQDALAAMDELLRGYRLGSVSDSYLGSFDAIHASPPCQAYARSTAWRGSRENHPRLIAPTRDLLEQTGLPYVIENVPDARRELRNPILICGSAVGLQVRRHRYFEANWPISILSHPCHHKDTDYAFEHKDERAYADAMGCEWMTAKEAREAIPPAYTELIGHQLMQQIRANTTQRNT